jgi:Na+-driven multidrug efflux pump
VINTILNLILVIGFHMSVVGVGIATDIANMFCAGVIVWLLHREEGAFKLHIRRMKIYGTELKRILQIGVPAGVQSMVFSLSNIFVQSAINGYGAAAVAGASVAQSFDSYCYFLMSAFSGAAVTFISQNYGAGQMERCKRVFWICLAGGVAVCFAGNMLFITFADEVLSIFTTDAEVVQNSGWSMC